MKFNLYFLIICLIEVALIIACPCFMNPVVGNAYLAIYISSKCVFGLLFICCFLYCFFKKTANGTTFSLIGITSLLQLLPLAIRGIFIANNHPVLWSIILLGASLILYVAFLGGIIVMGNKMTAADEKYAGHEIPLK